MMKKVLFRLAFACLATAALAQAQPRLALRTPDALTRPIWAAVGSNGPTDLSLEAYNEGDGQLDLSVDGGFAAWLTPQLGDSGPCSFDAATTCRTVRVLFDSDELDRGVYRGEVTVSSPGAVDAPQTIAITLYVGGDVPQEVDLYVPPVEGATDSIDFQTPAGPAPDLGVAGSFLSVSSNSLGSFRFLHDHRLIGRYRAGLAMGENSGSLFVSGSAFEPDNRVVPVTLNVTTSPIGRPSSTALVFETAVGVTPSPQAVAVANRGQGSLTINDVTAEGGDWLSAEVTNGVALVRANPDGLEPGLFEGMVTVTTNAVNSPHVIPVAFTINESGAPIAAFRGAVNGATFESTRPLAPLTISTVFGDQLSYEQPVQADTLPLPTELGGARVLVNGVPAPLFFVSYGQINFQTPNGLAGGEATVQVERDGMAGNEILTHIAQRSIGVFRFNRGEYGAIRNATQGNFPLPRSFSAPGFETAPARPGDVLEIFATGLGPVSPDVGTGEPAPSSPLAHVVGNPVVSFGFGFLTPQRTPLFVGLAPGFVGLFQVNIVVPEDAATNPRTPLVLRFTDGSQISNVVEIAIER